MGFAPTMMTALLLFATALADDPPRPAATILAEIAAWKAPEAPADRSRDAVRAHNKAARDAEVRKHDLAGELFAVQPDHSELAKLLPARWSYLIAQGPSRSALAGKEARAVLKRTKDAALKVEAAHVVASLAAGRVQADPDAAVEAIDDFLALAPEDRRGATLLNEAARGTTDLAVKTDLRDRLAAAFPEAAPRARPASARERIGQPFELEFTDAVSGTPLAMAAFRGKVVVIDFWATWCGPCIAEMPKMKALYEKYHDQGVEFVGVSLDAEDDSGRQALRAFVDKNDIYWPQHYPGNAFAQSWGVNAIPTLFVVDAEGKLHTTEARGKLETLLPELLKKAATGTRTGPPS